MHQFLSHRIRRGTASGDTHWRRVAPRPIRGVKEPYYSQRTAIEIYRRTIIAEMCSVWQQEPGANGTEILNSLKYVRPGGGFEPTFAVSSKLRADGEGGRQRSWRTSALLLPQGNHRRRRRVKLKFHGSSFLVASSRHPRQDVANMSRGNRACRRGFHEDATRMLRGNCCRGI